LNTRRAGKPDLREIRVFLLLVFVMLLVALGVLFFVGTLFVQSFIFTEVTEGLAWRAPAAAAAMAAFFTFWCVLVVNSGAKADNIPYTTIFNFHIRSDMFAKPVTDIWAYRGDGQVLHYTIASEVEFGHEKTYYRNAVDPTKRFTNTGVAAVEIETEPGRKSKFTLPNNTEGTEGGNAYFVNDEGWKLENDRDISGNPTRVSWALLFGNVLLNVLHFALWFVCLWLILRFSVGSSLLFGAILWGLTTIALLPMLLDQAASYH
jgi:hypothetical protein